MIAKFDNTEPWRHEDIKGVEAWTISGLLKNKPMFLKKSGTLGNASAFLLHIHSFKRLTSQRSQSEKRIIVSCIIRHGVTFLKR